MAEAKTMNKSQQRVHDVAEKQRQQSVYAKGKGYNTYAEYKTAMRWLAIRWVSGIAVVTYVFFDYVVKWF